MGEFIELIVSFVSDIFNRINSCYIYIWDIPVGFFDLAIATVILSIVISFFWKGARA